jgi:S-adenosylmethionine:tRNA ribosyltransferase-isomerase
MTIDPGKISVADYHYDLPEHRIAKFPLKNRDQSKLLLCRKGEIGSGTFSHLAEFIPENSLMVFNETMVILARLVFYKESGAKIEVFCLEPAEPTTDIELAFRQKPPVIWKCLIGNVKKWKEGKLKRSFYYQHQSISLSAEKIRSAGNSFYIRFFWDPPEMTFSEILEISGLVPLPPYLNREEVASDRERYQTIYAMHEGSVAAPTAGLHFTEKVFENLGKKNIKSAKLTLHVGAGTFKPVSAPDIRDHEMHTEKMVIDRELLEQLIENPDNTIVAVGTTSTRTLESIYWFGVKLLIDKDNDNEFHVGQWDPYNKKYDRGISVSDALQAVKSYMCDQNLDALPGTTRLIILPGYDFKIVNGLITNFHMPGSTLLLLVAALTGENWRKAYQYALDNDFRFLSYGDSCLFFP